VPVHVFLSFFTLLPQQAEQDAVPVRDSKDLYFVYLRSPNPSSILLLDVMLSSRFKPALKIAIKDDL